MSDAAVAEMVANSPLKATAVRPLPKYFSVREVDFGDLFAGAVMKTPEVTEEAAVKLVEDLGTKNHWLTPLPQVTNPYRGNGPSTPYTGTAYQSRHVGDVYDTSPYDPLEPPDIAPYAKQERPLGISTSQWVSNMAKLVSFVAPVK
jgi:hypothetical protein